MTRMGLRTWNRLRYKLAKRLAPRCGDSDCVHGQSLLRRIRGRSLGVRMNGAWYCLPECLERAVAELLPRMRPANKRPGTSPHRVPLGLLLLSRHQLTIEQLRAALAAQQNAGRGRIGEWLQELGFVTEQQVTAALARQWSCPLLATSPIARQVHATNIPVRLLEAIGMIPVNYVELTGTLHIACADRIDYATLYLIEQMLGCRIETCLVCPSTLRQGLQKLTQRLGDGDVVFDHVADVAEFARIVRSYATKVGATEVRLAMCGARVWIRLERHIGDAVNLVLHAPPETSVPASLATRPA